MHPNRFDEILFRGIPDSPNHSSSTFFTSLCVHVAGLAVLLVATPQIVVQIQPRLRFNTTLIAPPVPQQIPEPEPVRAPAVIAAAPLPRPLRPLPRLIEPRIVPPKLDQAPQLPNTPRTETALPVQTAMVRPPVQTGLFGANLPPEIAPKLPVPLARDAGFDREASQIPPAPQPAKPASAGFDTRSAGSRPKTATAVIQTGAFEQAPPDEKPAALDRSVRKTGFDEPKAVAAPAQRTAPAPAIVRPVEILEKPKPVYTAEARAQKIEGTVLLDVTFAATGEVRVLGVVRGLGHGLDENAIDAARRIRFTPAIQAGAPVDQRVVLHVVFQITG